MEEAIRRLTKKIFVLEKRKNVHIKETVIDINVFYESNKDRFDTNVEELTLLRQLFDTLRYDNKYYISSCDFVHILEN